MYYFAVGSVGAYHKEGDGVQNPYFARVGGLFSYMFTHGGGRMGVVAVCVAVCMAIWFNCFAVQ